MRNDTGNTYFHEWVCRWLGSHRRDNGGQSSGQWQRSQRYQRNECLLVVPDLEGHKKQNKKNSVSITHILRIWLSFSPPRVHGCVNCTCCKSIGRWLTLLQTLQWYDAHSVGHPGCQVWQGNLGFMFTHCGCYGSACGGSHRTSFWAWSAPESCMWYRAPWDGSTIRQTRLMGKTDCSDGLHPLTCWLTWKPYFHAKKHIVKLWKFLNSVFLLFFFCCTIILSKTLTIIFLYMSYFINHTSYKVNKLSTSCSSDNLFEI